MSLIPRIVQTTAAQELSSPEMRRYARHLIMPEVTVEGQRKLKASRVLAIGTGGLGSPLLAYLAAAGVGRLGIIDFDRVDESNLQRQIIHRQTSIGQPKVESARRTISELNPHVEVVTHEVALRSDNALDLLRDYDIVVDGTDNFPTRNLARFPEEGVRGKGSGSMDRGLPKRRCTDLRNGRSIRRHSVYPKGRRHR